MRKKAYALGVFMAVFYFALFTTAMGALLSRWIDHYQLAEARQGIPAALFSAGCLLALITSLGLMGRVPKPHLFWMASAATVLFAIPLGLPPSFAVFSALFLALGVAVGYTDTLASSSIADLYAGKRAAAMMCVLHATFGVAGVALPPLYNAVMEAGIPWNGIYAGIAGIGVVFLAFLIPVSVREARASEGQRAVRARFSMREAAEFFGDRSRAFTVVSVFFYALFLSGISIWLDRYVRVGLESADMGRFALPAFWLGLTVSRLTAPFLRVRPMTLIRLSSIAAAAVLTAALASGDARFVVMAAAGASLLTGAAIPLLLHAACKSYPSNTLMATTFLFIALYIGQGISPPLIGHMASTAGLGAAMYLCPATLLASGAAAFMIDNKQEG